MTASNITLKRNSTELLTCTQLELRAGYNTLIHNLSFVLHKGESLAVTGSNGIGKTTLLRSLAGISKPHAGSVQIFGESIWPYREVSYKHSVLFLSHIPALFLDHNVQSNIIFYIKTYFKTIQHSSILNALNRVGLKGKDLQTARTLSTGQKRRLTLAALLLIRPSLVFADELTNGLDEDGHHLCYEIFNELQQEYQCAFVLASHDKKLENWCQYKINLHQFKLIPSVERFKLRSLA